MWKFLFAVILLSAEAQKLKLNLRENVREGIAISDMSDVEAYQESVTYRLPNNTRPEAYFINLNIGDFHENDMTFTGNVLITIRVEEDTDTITLHSSVNVDDVSLEMTNRTPILHDEPSFEIEKEFMIIKTKEVLKKGTLIRLNVDFNGRIGTAVRGVYRGSYLTQDNERRLGLLVLYV